MSQLSVIQLSRQQLDRRVRSGGRRVLLLSFAHPDRELSDLAEYRRPDSVPLRTKKQVCQPCPDRAVTDQLRPFGLTLNEKQIPQIVE